MGGQTRVRRPRSTSFIRCCLALGLLVFISTSCSGVSRPGVWRPGVSRPGAVRPTVKIGLVAPFEGRYRYVGYDAIYAVRLALREVNQRGGVSGYGVTLVAYDDRGEPAMAAEQVRKLAVDPDVLGALGHFRDPTTAAALSAYGQAGLPLVMPTTCGTGPSTVTARGLAPPVDRLASALLDRAEGLAGGGDIVLVAEGSPAAGVGPTGGESSLAGALQAAARSRGLELAVVPPDAEGAAQSVLDRDPAVLLSDLDPVTAGEVVASLRQAGWTGDLVGGPALGVSDFTAVAGAAAAGATFVTPWPFPQDLPGGDAFVEAYGEVSNGVKPGPLALPAYEAALLLLGAVERAAAEGPPTRESVSAVLSTIQREDLLRPLSFDREPGPQTKLYWYRIGSDGVPDPLS